MEQMGLPPCVNQQVQKRTLFAVVPQDPAHGNRMSPVGEPEKVLKQPPVIVFAPVGVVACLGIAVGRVDINHAVVRDGDSGKIGRRKCTRER